MNIRQKAKRFKKLYEQGLPKKPCLVIYQSPKKHYKVQLMIDRRELIFAEDEQLFKKHIENCMLDKLRPIIWDNLIVEEDTERDRHVYTLDIWA